MNFNVSPCCCLDRAGEGAEIIVEQRDQCLVGQRVRQLGETAQVGEPDDGAHVLALAALDLALQHALAGDAPDIGVEQHARGAAQGLDLQQVGEVRHQHLERRDLGILEPALLAGGEGHRLDGAVGKRRGQGDVVAEAFLAQVRNDADIRPAAPPASHAPGPARRRDRRRRAGCARNIERVRLVICHCRSCASRAGSHTTLEEAICGCSMGMPVVIRSIGSPISTSCSPRASTKASVSIRRRPGPSSQPSSGASSITFGLLRRIAA